MLLHNVLTGKVFYCIQPCPPSIAHRGVTAFNAGLFRVAWAAERLQIAQVIGKFRMRPDRLDVIHFKPSPCAAFNALEVIAPKRLHS